jgi:hypothetical protein
MNIYTILACIKLSWNLVKVGLGGGGGGGVYEEK